MTISPPVAAPPDLATRLRETRAATEALAAPLAPEDQVVQSMPDVSPTKWHRAHTTWFFETFVLGPHQPGYRPVEPGYDYLFNSYYEQVGPRHPRAERGLISRPTVAEVGAYRTAVDHALGSFIDGTARERWDDVGPLIELGIHHEQQHQELLLMDIKHVLSRNPLHPAYADAADITLPGDAVPISWIDVAGGIDAGRPRRAAASRSTTRAPATTSCCSRSASPTASSPTATGWRSWPTAATSGPSCGCPTAGPPCSSRAGGPPSTGNPTATAGPSSRSTACGRSTPSTRSSTSATSRPTPTPPGPAPGSRPSSSGRWPPGATASRDATADHELHLHPTGRGVTAGLGQAGTEVWEWTASAYLPYPGFQPPPGAVGEYNGKFMCGQMVLRGGACITPPGHARPSYRNFFPPAARWAFAGLRLATDA